jgi:Ni,Fe-hydrogenase III large subunit/Ni,Fe-hydrogenase III component G
MKPFVLIREVPGPDLFKAAAVISESGKFPVVAMFGCDERLINGCFSVCVLIDMLEPGKFQLLKGMLPADGTLEYSSLTSLFPGVAWYEREMCDLFGLFPTGHPDLRPLVLHEAFPEGIYPLRKDFMETQTEGMVKKVPSGPFVQGEGVFEVPVGPIHAGIIEPGHFRFSQAGEDIIQVEPKLFYTHRGIEKALEGQLAEQAIFKVERICGACSVSNSLSFTHALESVSQTEIPERAEYIRVVLAELERLYNHVGDIGNMCAGVGFAAGASHGSRMKETLMRLNEAAAGNRFLRGMIVPGGVVSDISNEIARQIQSVMYSLEEDFDELIVILEGHAALLDRWVRTGILSHSAALELGVVGPAARACGQRKDLRKDHPYSVYGQLDFQVPGRTAGDAAARVWVRADEVIQSIGIIKQALLWLVEHPGIHRTNLLSCAAWTPALGWSESARGANYHWIMIDGEQRIWRYFVRSASYPNWPAVAVSAPGNIIADFPVINKSFELCYACLDR